MLLLAIPSGPFHRGRSIGFSSKIDVGDFRWNFDRSRETKVSPFSLALLRSGIQTVVGERLPFSSLYITLDIKVIYRKRRVIVSRKCYFMAEMINVHIRQIVPFRRR